MLLYVGVRLPLPSAALVTAEVECTMPCSRTKLQRSRFSSAVAIDCWIDAAILTHFQAYISHDSANGCLANPTEDCSWLKAAPRDAPPSSAQSHPESPQPLRGGW